MNKELFKKNIIPILISTVLVVIISNFHLHGYDKFFLFPITILTITYVYILNNNNLVVNRRGYYYLIPIILIIGGTFFFKTNISNMLLNIVIIPILISMLALSLTNKNYQVSGKFLNWFAKLFPTDLLSNLGIIGDNIKITTSKKKRASNIALGILISIPLVFIILTLLTSADMYFNAFIDKISDNFTRLFLNFKFIKNNLLILIIYFVILFSTIVNIFKNKDTKLEAGKIRSIETTIISPILIMMNLVFLLFVVSEISKITGNFLELPAAYTYSEYARAGFFQLLAVTVINFTIILLLLYKTDALEKHKLLKYLILLLLGFTIILIFNSYYRMYLYINRFGFTVLRMQVVLFLLMELILSFVIIKKSITNLKHKDAYIFLYTIITTYILNIFICNINVITFINKLINK